MATGLFEAVGYGATSAVYLRMGGAQDRWRSTRLLPASSGARQTRQGSRDSVARKLLMQLNAVARRGTPWVKQHATTARLISPIRLDIQHGYYFVMSLPHSDGIFIKAYPAETTEAFCDGHVSAFASWVECRRASCTTTRRLPSPRYWEEDVASARERSRSCSRTTCQRQFGRVGKGNDKGSVEGMVGYGRRNFLVPIPRADSFDELNAHLESECLERMDARLRGTPRA